MKFSDKYPNLTDWFTSGYHVVHFSKLHDMGGGGVHLSLFDQGREVWNSENMTDLDLILGTAEMWIQAEYGIDDDDIMT